MEDIRPQLAYWKIRCALAETYISRTPCDPDTSTEQKEAWDNWKAWKKNPPKK